MSVKTTKNIPPVPEQKGTTAIIRQLVKNLHCTPKDQGSSEKKIKMLELLSVRHK